MAFNNGPRLFTNGLAFLVDAADKQSYPGSGTTWTDLRLSITGSLTGSVSYSSNYYGGLVFAGPTASIAFPGTVANFGTSSFTVELVFQPSQINGIHYLISKNSGSFPNWGVYLSGSSGSGKLVSFYNISSSISCSVTSSTTFVTGSNYFIDVQHYPALSGSVIYSQGSINASVVSNGVGSLTSTGSLFIGNVAPSSSQAFSGSIFNVKIYQNTSNLLPYINLTSQFNRISINKPSVLPILPVEYLVVAGGGGGNRSGAGGAGGVLVNATYLSASTSYNVFVGAGGLSSNATVGSNGQNSYFLANYTIGGGGGGAFNGGSGGGNYGSFTAGTGISGQGNNGGVAPDNNEATGGGGGGGGAGTPGSSSYGGSGSYYSQFAAIGGSPAGWFGGGGSGWGIAGGIGGGGLGGRDPDSGVANTGGGGGRRGNGVGGNGGSGIVAIRYLGNPVATGGTITQLGGYTYHVFSTTGSSIFTVF